MREIKFRAWNMKNAFYTDRFVESNLFNLIRSGEPVMQFTGLHDKNGKEIYEGDIMRHVPDGNAPHLPFIVSWSEILLAWSIHDEARKWCEYLNERKHNYIVIGNIYENPELLEANAPRS